MNIFLIVSAIALGLFSVVLLFGAPYLPTRRTQSQAALDLLNLKTGQVFYDLGCGDGRVLRAAAKRGLNCVGYELNPLLAIYAYLATIRFRKNVKIHFGDFWRADISNADGIFVFLVGAHMTRLDKFIKTQKFSKSTKVASYAFQIPDKKPLRSKSGIFLYQY